MEFTSLRLAVDKRLEERQKLISRFNTQIQKDINVLIDKVSIINDEAMVSCTARILLVVKKFLNVAHL